MSPRVSSAWLWYARLWAAVAIFLAMGVMGAGRNRQARQLQSSSNLYDLLDRLDTSIQENRIRLQRGLPTISHHYRTDVEAAGLEEGPTIIQESWEDDATHLEDTSDYVNAAPWTRRRPVTASTLAEHDLRKIKLASDNARWVDENGKCDVPPRRCLPVKPSGVGHAARTWPRCALLHRCGEDAGCCNSRDKTCATAESHTVQLYFYVFDASRAGVQMMTFTNDTRCSCQSSSTTSNSNNGSLRCQCPQFFSPLLHDGRCVCDCDAVVPKCRRYKKGRRFFSNEDINCISSGSCAQPTCEYGSYQVQKGRCTKRRERERNSKK